MSNPRKIYREGSGSVFAVIFVVGYECGRGEW